MRGVLAAIVRFIIVVGALWPQHAAVQFSVVVASTWASLVALPVATNTDGLRAFHSDASSHLQALNAVSELAARETGIVPGAELHQARNDVGANLSTQLFVTGPHQTQGLPTPLCSVHLCSVPR